MADFVLVFTRIETSIAKRLRTFAACKGKLLRTVVEEALDEILAASLDKRVLQQAVHRYAALLAKKRLRVGLSLQILPAQKEKISRLGRQLKVKKQIIYGAALMAYLTRTR